MNHRLLPGVVFLVCVVAGFGVGFEADGQSTDDAVWTQPEWELPWGMVWPDPEEPSVEAESDSTAQAASDVVDDESGSASDTVVVEGPSADPGIFPALVTPKDEPEPEAAPAASEVAGGTPDDAAGAEAPGVGAGEPGEAAVAGTINAQLTQIEALEQQLQTLSEATKAARATMEAALAGIPNEPEEPEEPATPEQVELSMVLLTDMVKKMKPSKAASLLAEWDDTLAIGILRRLGSRRATPILSKMPVTLSGRLTSKIAAGVGAVLPVTATATEEPSQGEVE